jgi:hypothetical protein
VASEREDIADPESTADRLEDWRQVERDSDAQVKGSILGRLAHKAADRARDLFHCARARPTTVRLNAVPHTRPNRRADADETGRTPAIADLGLAANREACSRAKSRPGSAFGELRDCDRGRLPDT